MGATTIKVLKRTGIALTVIAVALLALRAFEVNRGESLSRWHTFVPPELSRDELARSDWKQYLERERALFDGVRSEVTAKLPPEERLPSNRYFDGSPIYPGGFATDWNRSYVLEPAGRPVGAVVLLHGLTDSPYSLRHIARRYRERGFVAIAIRLPGHGTVPAGLTEATWEDWIEATRLAVREARRRVAAPAPLHLVGFSNGGALALKHALDALGDATPARPDRVVLISPMIGITAFARFAGFFGLPALLPAFAEAAWLGIVPEFNPFKYNSFPVHAARQSSTLTRVLQEQIGREVASGRIERLAPVLTFQSVVDFTVSTRAVVTALYAQLPANGSELVLFDLNRSYKFGPLLRASAETVLTRLLPDPPRAFRTTVVANADLHSGAMVERVIEAGATAEEVRDLGLAYPPDVYSLSHVALPFPVTDSLYGITPDATDFYGAHLGAMAARGERGTLIVSLDTLSRMASNPFFPLMLGRIEAGITAAAPPPKAASAKPVAPGKHEPAPKPPGYDAGFAAGRAPDVTGP